MKTSATYTDQAAAYSGAADDERTARADCEPECPVDAIKPDTEPGIEQWLEINAKYAQVWPNITIKREPPPDAKDWEGKPDKADLLSPNPGTGD